MRVVVAIAADAISKLSLRLKYN